jgi:hypothetical protein
MPGGTLRWQRISGTDRYPEDSLYYPVNIYTFGCLTLRIFTLPGASPTRRFSIATVRSFAEKQGIHFARAGAHIEGSAQP